MANVAFARPEYNELLPQYAMIRDCIAGEVAVKKAGTLYLPKPDKENPQRGQESRYSAYKKRAVFYNVTRRTLSGLVGQVFMTDPIIKLPAELEAMINNVDGSGVNLTQQSKKVLSMTLAFSRSGLFVDYPKTEGIITKQQMNEGNIKPIIIEYSPQEIINWRTRTIGSDEVVSLVVLMESYITNDDGFEMKHALSFRVLYLNEDNVYVQEVWKEKESPTEYKNDYKIPTRTPFIVKERTIPVDAAGNPFNRIPFVFVGSTNNDPNPDNPNMYDLASINIAHYRNSADYEESCFIVGQPTPVVTGLSEHWLKEVLKGTIAFGSRSGIPLPENADCKLLQSEPNTMIFEAMENKERQMVALGAKLVEQKQVQRTAFEAKMESTSDGSVLASTTNNVAAAYMDAFRFCCQFAGVDDGSIEFVLNTDFDIARMTPEERNQAIKEWQSGAITFNEMRAVLRKAKIATEDDTKAQADIAKAEAEALAMEVKVNEAGGNNDTAS